MCDAMISIKKQEREKLKSLKVDQLFSVEILVDNIVVTHGPYKNSGDLDHVTESEDSDNDGKDGDMFDEFGMEGDGGDGQPDGMTVGMALLDCRSRSKSPRIKKTCHTIAIDSWAPGVISSKPYVPEETNNNPCCDNTPKPLQLCKSCLNDCLMNKPKKSDKCTCEKEYCYSFPIDSLGPKIRSSSGIPRKKCTCPGQKKRGASRDKSKKGGDTESDDDTSRGKGDVVVHRSETKKKGSADGKKKGKDKGGKGKEKESGGKGKGKGKSKPDVKVEEEEEPQEEPPPEPKKKKKKCPKPPIPDGPLPPLRVSISLFHIKDVKINQVDLDKLYPTDDADIPGEDSDHDLEITSYGPRVSKEQFPGENVKKVKAEKTDKKEKDKGKQAKKSSSKSSGSSKQGKDKGNKSASKISAASKNVVKLKKGKQGVDVTELSEALSTLRHSQPSQATEEEHHLSGLSKYKGLGGWDVAKCSGDLPLKMKQARKMQRMERERRKEVITSLRGITDFKRGISFVFASTPLNIISRLLVEKLEIVVDRCSNTGPSFPIGKAKIKLPNIYRDRVQAGARESTMRALWTCLEDTYPIIDCKGTEVGNITLYFCLTSLGRAMVSTSLVSEASLYEYAGSACYISQNGNAEPVRATGFKLCNGNLQHINLKDYTPPKKPTLHF